MNAAGVIGPVMNFFAATSYSCGSARTTTLVPVGPVVGRATPANAKSAGGRSSGERTGPLGMLVGHGGPGGGAAAALSASAARAPVVRRARVSIRAVIEVSRLGKAG